MKTERYRLLIDFRTEEQMRVWFEEAQRLGLLPEKAKPRPVDGLDKLTGGIEQFIARDD